MNCFYVIPLTVSPQYTWSNMWFDILNDCTHCWGLQFTCVPRQPITMRRWLVWMQDDDANANDRCIASARLVSHQTHELAKHNVLPHGNIKNSFGLLLYALSFYGDFSNNDVHKHIPCSNHAHWLTALTAKKYHSLRVAKTSRYISRFVCHLEIAQ